ncbi:MAG: 3'(2'),5'-bisphosphate nucleotidase CysQ [Hyphomicrobiaceae bacterium]
MTDCSTLISEMNRTALDAGRLIREIYERDFATERKADGSPVTEADKRAEALILERLNAAAPEIPIVSEENAASHSLSPPDRFFLVDPLDGTKEFVSRNGEFTVNIALIERGVPALGVVYAPVKGGLYWVDAQGHAVEAREGTQTAIRARPAPASGLVAAVSRSHLDQASQDYLARYTIAGTISAGSSLKFCLVARGEADVYPRFGPTNEWDTAAGDAVLRAAGGSMLTPEGEVFRYGKPGYRNGPYVAWGRR